MYFFLASLLLAKHVNLENIQNDHQRLIALIIEPILPTYAIRHIRSSVKRVFILIPGGKGSNCGILFCQEFVFFLLPLINIHKLKNMIVRQFSSPTSLDKQPSIKVACHECGICNEPPSAPHQGQCGHVFCYYCVKVITTIVVVEHNIQCYEKKLCQWKNLPITGMFSITFVIKSPFLP